MSLLAVWCAWLVWRFGRKSGAATPDLGRKAAVAWWPAPLAMRWDGFPEAVWIDEDELEEVVMATNRCSTCSANWPQQPRFRMCPDCGEKTDPVYNDEPMDIDEALERLEAGRIRVEDERRSKRLHEEFEKFYAARAEEQAKAFADEMAARMG